MIQTEVLKHVWHKDRY